MGYKWLLVEPLYKAPKPCISYDFMFRAEKYKIEHVLKRALDKNRPRDQKDCRNSGVLPKIFL